MRTTSIAALAMLLAFPLQAQEHDPDNPVGGGGTLPDGWTARTDRGKQLTDVKFWKMGNGWHVTLGPAAVLYREADQTTGEYTLQATFTQTKAPRHAEGYGLIIGGSDLQGEDQQYTYFLVRQDGKFLVKQRTGDKTQNVTSGWISHDAVMQKNEEGKATNALAVRVTGDACVFEVNGTEVHRVPASAIETDGIVGMRVNHNLDVLVAGFSVIK